MLILLLTFILTIGVSSCSNTTSEAQDEYILLEKIRESPEKTREICSKTKSMAILEQCKKIKNRPHLYKGKTKEQNRHNKYKSPLEAVPASSTSCSDNVVRCRTGNALIAKSQKERVAECNSLERTIWKSECFFETAENGLKSSKLSYAEASELCSMSNSLVYNCLQHLSIVLADRYKTIDGAHKGMEIVTSYWKSRDIGQSKKMKSIFWMTFIEIYLSKKTHLDQTIFSETDTDLHRFIWSALTARILKSSQKNTRLSDRTQSLLNLYYGKKTIRLQKNTAQNKHAISKKMIPKFSSNYTSVLYHGEQKRVLGNTVQEEIEICFIMASFTLQRHLFLIEDAKQSSSPLVVSVAQALK